MKGGIMRERRSSRRKRPTYYLRVFDENTDSLAGSLIDISTDGLMLASRKKFRPDENIKIRLALPDAIVGERTLTIKAKNVWCRKELDSGIHDYFSAGFAFENIAMGEAEMISESMRNYLFQE